MEGLRSTVTPGRGARCCRRKARPPNSARAYLALPTIVRVGPRTRARWSGKSSRILRSADGRASGIILMHDTHPTLRDILGALIEELKRRGYTLGGTARGSDLPLHRPRQAKDR